MPTKKTYKIGTRGSLLAVTQCTQIKDLLESNSDASFELIQIKTQGDLNTDKPLWQLDGKDFFTKELDTALITGQVDLVVHSYKDLGSERPEGIELAAVTERKFPNDILLIKKETLAQIKDLKTFTVGTSSPRRITNLESTLASWLPSFHGTVKCEMLRGNVNSRIQKLRDGSSHAITLAHAGLERLALHSESVKELKVLLEGLTYLILPASEFAPAASQGALALEYFPGNHQNDDLIEILKTVHDSPTKECVKRERKAFNEYGGGCHLAVGVHVVQKEGHFVHLHKGVVDDKQINICIQEDLEITSPKKNRLVVLGSNNPALAINELKPSLEKDQNYFCTSKYCIPSLNENSPTGAIFSAGSRTAKQLVENGFWVNASADGLGHGELEKLLSSKSLEIMHDYPGVKVLSHSKASSQLGEVVGCYERTLNNLNDAQKSDFLSKEDFYWNSFSHYEHYMREIPELIKKSHFCGLGKTLEQFKSNNIEVTPVYQMSLFKGTQDE